MASVDAQKAKDRVCVSCLIWSLSDCKLTRWQGNDEFKAGKYAEAVGHYSAAIAADRNDPTFPLNRAAAYLKLGKYVSLCTARRRCQLIGT